jgi:hypothetical protein
MLSESCEATGSREDSGLFARGLGTHAEACDCRFGDNHTYGVCTGKGAAAELTCCTLAGNRLANVAFLGGARYVLSACEARGSEGFRLSADGSGTGESARVQAMQEQKIFDASDVSGVASAGVCLVSEVLLVVVLVVLCGTDHRWSACSRYCCLHLDAFHVECGAAWDKMQR